MTNNGKKIDDNFFPKIISKLPKADIPINGLSSHILQGSDQQILFMEFEYDIEKRKTGRKTGSNLYS